VRQTIVEQSLPAAEDDGMDEQDVRIDQLVAHQRLQQIAAAQNDEVEARLRFQVGDRVRRLTGKNRIGSPSDLPFDGLLVHAAGEGPNGFCVFDVFESTEGVAA